MQKKNENNFGIVSENKVFNAESIEEDICPICLGNGVIVSGFGPDEVEKTCECKLEEDDYEPNDDDLSEPFTDDSYETPTW